MRLFSIFALLVCCVVCFEIAEGDVEEVAEAEAEAEEEKKKKAQREWDHEVRMLRAKELRAKERTREWDPHLQTWRDKNQHPDHVPFDREAAEKSLHFKEPVEWGVISLISLIVGTMLVTWIQGALAKSDAASTEASADDGEWGSVSGTITREAGFDKAITITLLGLPKGYTAPSIEIAGDVNEYTLPIQFPKESKPGDLKNIKLVATAASEPKVEVQVVTTTLD